MLEKAILGMVCSMALSGEVNQGYSQAAPISHPIQTQECILDEENWRTLLKGYNNSIPVGHSQNINKNHLRKNKKPINRYFRHR
jgi:hypothetical protein